MKNRALVFMLQIVLVCIPAMAMAYDSGSSGADGAFNPQGDTEVVLPDDGILNYTIVNIPSGVTVTFKKNSINTPVYMLATGDVTIAGSIDVSGTSATSMTPGKGGPGGFDGGLGGAPGQCGGAGLGPGGGMPGTKVRGNRGSNGSGGSFGSVGIKGTEGASSDTYSGDPGEIYGNEENVPLSGGSGGSGGCAVTGYYAGAGGGGAGAILISTPGNIDLSGEIKAIGGIGGNGAQGTASYYYDNGGGGGGGSGGAIKLIAHSVSGSGSLSANFGAVGRVWSGRYNSYRTHSGRGGVGRIRIETPNNTYAGSSIPANYSYSVTQSEVFPVATPELKIVSIGGKNVPDMATGSFSSPDIIISRGTGSTVDVVVEASHIPAGTDVVVEARPELGAVKSATAALAGSETASSATASLSLDMDRISVITVTATYTLQTASNSTPLYVNGEIVEKIRVMAALGGASKVTYITASGREIAL